MVVGTAGDATERLDIFLVIANQIIAVGGPATVLLGRGVCESTVRLLSPVKDQAGDTIARHSKGGALELKGESIPLEILHEDDVLLLLNKPAGLVVHTAPGHWPGHSQCPPLHFQNSGGTVDAWREKERPGLVIGGTRIPQA